MGQIKSRMIEEFLSIVEDETFHLLQLKDDGSLHFSPAKPGDDTSANDQNLSFLSQENFLIFQFKF